VKISNVLKNPPGLSPVQNKNFTNVKIDAIGVGLANAASPFLSVFLTRLGASSFEVGLLTSMPALTGLLLSIPLGQFLQNQRKIVPWFSAARLGVLLSYGLTGLIAFFLKDHPLIIGVLAIWALATIPQSVLNITFSVVMNAVAGPNYRFELMMRRWSILGFTTAVMVFVVGQLLESIRFPLNYQISFIILSIGALISYYFSSQITLDDIQSHSAGARLNFKDQINEYVRLVKKEKPFQSFIIKRFVVLTGSSLVLPVFPLYFVRTMQASDGWIATINMVQTAIVIIGYFFWTYRSRKNGTRSVLLWTTFGTALYPILAAFMPNVVAITVLAGINGIFQAGLNLVFFDELMKTVPPEYSSTFIALAQGIQYFSSIAAPLIGTFIGDQISLSFALVVGGVLQFLGFILFLKEKPPANEPALAAG
jgi:hypothetical protein